MNTTAAVCMKGCTTKGPCRAGKHPAQHNTTQHIPVQNNTQLQLWPRRIERQTPPNPLLDLSHSSQNRHQRRPPPNDPLPLFRRPLRSVKHAGVLEKWDRHTPVRPTTGQSERVEMKREGGFLLRCQRCVVQVGPFRSPIMENQGEEERAAAFWASCRFGELRCRV